MYLTMNHMISISMILLLLTMTITTISKKTMLNLQKSSPFECGFNPMSKKRLPFSIHFFLIAVIFLIFDVEVIMILPTLFTMKYSIIINWMITVTIFISILIWGVMHEWYNGMLNWTK
uniref:NADH-ubiquinone oxidoreductase chain 3 n=1 Tax=Hylica paradoxa TaxID=2027056 RepID=A0A7T7BYV4_9HEMI|nr:NADH dehydrogenase subunit 3 [Hylica paradoxa]QQK57687.1 NADH dehydrogenase subunit 3 [Hylica paradoxa]